MEAAALNKIVEKFRNDLEPSSLEFLGRVFSKPTEVYQERLHGHGFVALRYVLDAACGFGQWTLALSKQCERVAAVDISQSRLNVLRDILDHEGVGNVETSMGSVSQLPFEDETFDGVFSYATLKLTPWREVLREFYRVLKPGGCLYVNASSIGWYNYLWKTAHNASAGYDTRMNVSKAYSNALKYERGLPTEQGTPMIIEPEDMKNTLHALGFSSVRIGPEGTVYVNRVSDAGKHSFFIGEYSGQTAVYECISVK